MQYLKSNEIESKIIPFVTRKLPKIKGMGFLANQLMKIYNRKKREKQIVSMFDYKMMLSPTRGIFFYPQLHDFKEVAYIKRNLKQGDVFVDVGTNIGFYTLLGASIVGNLGKVISIEADKKTFDELTKNIYLNHSFKMIDTYNVGISDEKEELLLYIQEDNTEGNSFIPNESSKKEVVSCLPLLDIIRESNLNSISFLKIDVEGFEYRILTKFFETAPETLWPERIMVEYMPLRDKDNTINYVIAKGYSLVKKIKFNYLLERNNHEK